MKHKTEVYDIIPSVHRGVYIQPQQRLFSAGLEVGWDAKLGLDPKTGSGLFFLCHAASGRIHPVSVPDRTFRRKAAAGKASRKTWNLKIENQLMQTCKGRNNGQKVKACIRQSAWVSPACVSCIHPFSKNSM